MLTRIERLGKLKPVSFDPEHDLEWNGTAKLRLHPHPGLTEEQSQAIQRDYDMREGVREIEMRLSLAYYFIKRMNLDLDDLEPARAQIKLANLREVEAAINDARAASRKRAQVQALVLSTHWPSRSCANRSSIFVWHPLPVPLAIL